jgi:hypothetical protein
MTNFRYLNLGFGLTFGIRNLTLKDDGREKF